MSRPLPVVSGDGWLDEVRFDERGLVTAIAQEAQTQRILMVAWMDRAALEETAKTGAAVYWSRSRARLWRKGEESGNVQHVREIRTDCDGDVVLLMVEQVGGVACHTGRHSCFFRVLGEDGWEVSDPVLVDPAVLYRKT
jgi:phosphoribosyl-AMP cyclohydrolase